METTIAYKDAFQDSKTKFKQFSSGSLTGSEIVRSWLLDPKRSDNGDANLTEGIIASLISIWKSLKEPRQQSKSVISFTAQPSVHPEDSASNNNASDNKKVQPVTGLGR